MSPARDASSRYRDVPVVAVPDARGRVLAARDLRLLPDVAGTFVHIVVEGDRLDGLASAYYRRPLVWWHIADANPGMLSPWALVGADPVVTLTVPIRISGDPPWSDVLRALAALPGVEDVTVADDVELADEPQTVGLKQVVVTVGRPVRALAVRRNEATAARAGSTVADVVAAVTKAAFTVGPVVRSDGVGSAVVVPPTPTGGT
jgi:hypothetical protein